MRHIISPNVYDVAVVGSGAGGGMAAYVLAEAGANVVMLEAGPMWDAATDGDFLPPPAPRLHELLVMQGAAKMGIPVLANRLSILTKPHNGRTPCHFCAQCGRGCATSSNFSSPSVLLPPALRTGRLTIVDNAMAREVTTDQEGLATGVSYVNRNDMQEYTVRARTVVLAASTCETARLLLNSTSSRHPAGLANSSGAVGRYLMDSTGASVAGIFPQLVGRTPYNEDGVGGAHIYIPWFGYDTKRDFARGYHLEVWGGRQQPDYGFMGGIHTINNLFEDRPRGGGGYGMQLKQDYRDLYGSVVGFSARGEMVARYDNYCEIDPDVVDKYDIPVLRFHVRWSDEEHLQIKHAQEVSRNLVEAMGGEVLTPMPSKEDGYGILAPGRIIHEVGAVCMGDDPAKAPLNAWCQAHDARNVFVTDGAPFVSQAHKNTTWTILALAWRTADHIVELRNAGDL